MRVRIDRKSGIPLYHQLMEQIRSQILDGTLTPGTKLDTERKLMDDLDLSYPTVSRAMRELVHQGLVERRQGSGTFVRQVDRHIRTIALVIPRLHIRTDNRAAVGMNIAPQLVDAIEMEASRKNLNVMLYLANDDPAKERENLIKIRNQDPDGVILFYMGSKWNLDVLRELCQSGVPTVFIDRYIESIDADYVVTDNYNAAYRATKMLIDRGYRNIYHFTHPVDSTSLMDRKRGYEHAMKEAGLDPIYIVSRFTVSAEGGWTLEGQLRASEYYAELANDLLDRIELPFAFFFADPSFYIDTMRTITSRKIPHDKYGIACFDDPGPHLMLQCDMFIRIVQRLDDIGKRSVEVLLDKINGSSETIHQYIMPDMIID